MFQVGQKVVWVGTGRAVAPKYGEGMPRKGPIYTVREFCDMHPNGPALRVNEIINRPQRYLTKHGAAAVYECCWEISGFRPVVERKTDISIFTAMLSPTPAKERVTG